MLAIPLPAALTGAGATKGEAIALAQSDSTYGSTVVKKGEQSLYNRRDLTLIVRKGKAPLLVRKHGNRWDLMYVLKSSVRIPPRLRFFDTFRDWSGRPAALRFFSNSLKRLIKKLYGKGNR